MTTFTASVYAAVLVTLACFAGAVEVARAKASLVPARSRRTPRLAA